MEARYGRGGEEKGIRESMGRCLDGRDAEEDAGRGCGRMFIVERMKIWVNDGQGGGGGVWEFIIQGSMEATRHPEGSRVEYSMGGRVT